MFFIRIKNKIIKNMFCSHTRHTSSHPLKRLEEVSRGGHLSVVHREDEAAVALHVHDRSQILSHPKHW